MLFLLGCQSGAGKSGAAGNAPPAPAAGIRSTLAPAAVPPTAQSSGSGAPLSAAAAPAALPVIVCFGDSLTAGYNIDAGGSYPDDLQQLLDGKGYHYRVVNSGISGETTKDGLNRVARVIARHPELVVVEFGGNDGLRGVPVAETQRNLMAIVDKLQASGTKVALAGITLPPQFGGDYIRQFDAMYPAVGSKYHVPLLPFLLQDVYGIEGDIQEDGIHPTAQGAKQVALNVEKLITPMLHK